MENSTKNYCFFLFILLALLFSDGSARLYIVLPLLYAFSIFYIIKNTKKLFGFVKLKSARLLIYFIIWTFLSFLYNFIFTHADILRFLYSVFCTYIPSCIICVFIGTVAARYFSVRSLLKLINIAMSIILIFGFIEFIFTINNLGIIYKIISFTSGFDTTEAVIGKGLPRIRSFFSEPSHYAWFLVCNIPLFYSMKASKIKFFNNQILNIFQRFIYPLIIISLFMTQSPINIIIGLIVLILCEKKSIVFLIKSGIGILALAVIMCIIPNINIDNYGPIKRVVTTIQSFHEFNILIEQEQSLATRLVNYTNMFILFLKNFVFGLGCGQLGVHMQSQLLNSPLPLTPEIIYGLIFSNKSGGNPSIFFKVAMDTGIVGLILFYSSIILSALKIRKTIILPPEINYEIIVGLKHLFGVFILLSFYDSAITCFYFWILFGIYNFILYKYCFKIKKHDTEIIGNLEQVNK